MKKNQKTSNSHAEFVGQVCPTYKSIDFVKNVRFSAASNDSKTLNQVQGDKRAAFTLAEILITLTIIGVVAVMTIPNLISDVNQRKYNAASGNFQRKLGEALRVMNGQNTLSGYDDTKDFVAELQKNMKILKVCNTVTDCFPAKIKKSDGTVIQTSTLTDATSLGQNYGTKTVGVQFADGIRAIVAYNPDYTTQNNGDVVAFDKDDKNKTVSMRTNVISILFDVSEDDNNKIGEDIFQKNTNLGSSGVCEHTKVGDYCIKDIGTNYEALDCSSTTNTVETLKYCDKDTTAKDYWAGAKKACNELEMELPDTDILDEIYQIGIQEGGTPRSGYYWTLSSVYNFTDGKLSNYYNSLQHSYYNNTLCVDN